MAKKIQAFTTRQSFTDFTRKLAAKWRLDTTPTVAPQPQAKGALGTMRAILAQLVAFPTVTGNAEANRDALDYIDHFVSERGMYVKRLEWNGSLSLVATTRKTKKPLVMLAGHIDVVPGPEEAFELREKDGKLIGRGVLDMKFAIAAYLQVIDDLGDRFKEYDLGLMINTDEEVGGQDGAARLADEGYLPAAMVAPDGGNDWAIESQAKGMCWLSLTATGKSAHSSRPWEGESALEKLLAVLHEIQQLFPGKGPDDSTLNIGILRAGMAANQIPAEATATLDIRAVSVEDDKRLQLAIADICQKAGVALTTEIYSPPLIHDTTNPYIKGFAESIAKITGENHGFTKSCALNDTRFFAVKGVQCVVFYPTGGGHHGAEEWIDASAFYQVREVLHDYLEKTARR